MNALKERSYVIAFISFIGMVAFTCYLTTWEAETGGSQVQDQQCKLRHETLAYKKKIYWVKISSK